MTRDKYRDNDDVRRPLEDGDRTGGSADTKSEARGDARENIGNHSRGTAASPTGPEGNDKVRNKENARDEFDTTLEADD
jgi:hypothetical protein